MTIIDEMRREAGNAERSGHTYEALFMTEWADRLAASGALVPVPDGQGLEYQTIPPGVLFCADDLVATKSGDRSPLSEMEDAWVFGKSYPITTFKANTIVLPVRLVAITEAEI